MQTSKGVPNALAHIHPPPPSHGLGRWYENEDFNTEYFPSWSKCHDKLGDGCTIDFPIRLHSKLKWSSRTFIKQDDGTEMSKARSFEEVLVVDVRNMLMVLRTQ